MVSSVSMLCFYPPLLLGLDDESCEVLAKFPLVNVHVHVDAVVAKRMLANAVPTSRYRSRRAVSSAKMPLQMQSRHHQQNGQNGTRRRG